jgi:hypothetical protein
MPENKAPENNAAKDHLAPPDIDARRVFFVALAILLALAASLAAMVGFYGLEAPSRTFSGPRIFPAPRVFQDQGRERHELYAAQRRRLDEAAVPMAKAMELIAGRGQSAYSPLPQGEEKRPETAAAPEKPSIAAPPARPKLEQRRRPVHKRSHAFR